MSKSEKQIAQAVQPFTKHWHGRGYEKGGSQTFWLELLTEVFGVKMTSDFIAYENHTKLDIFSFIDSYIENRKDSIKTSLIYNRKEIIKKSLKRPANKNKYHINLFNF